MWGRGLITGMRVTLKHFFGKKETFSYPEEKLPMSERFRGGHLVLDLDKCIACKMCEMACPNKALQLKIAMDANKKRKMIKYLHIIGRCMYCDLCVEACPTKAIAWDKEYAFASWYRDDMEYDCVAKKSKRDEILTDKATLLFEQGEAFKKEGVKEQDKK